ncbi:MAG TPA: hypothetical protein VGI64_12000 [Streptosporangiaceae bacterium]
MASHDTPDQPPAHGRPGGRRPRVYVHIGEPKTGTTFLQNIMWGNRRKLAAQGVLLPGYRDRDHSRASRDIRGAKRLPNDPADPWVGEWDVQVGQALSARVAILSDELFGACNEQQADRAVRSLLSAELHVVLTVRDMASLLPAEWQEMIKVRYTTSFEDWLDDVVKAGASADRRRAWFWKVHDTLAILDMWSRHIPPEQVHVIIMPRGGPPDELWRRFASVVGIDPDSVDVSRARANTSLGLAETEFLRRMNAALPKEIPDWFYTRNIKRLLAHNVLDARPREARLALPPEREAWAKEQAETAVAGLRDAKYHIVGSLDELMPRPGPGPYISPADQPVERMLDAAVQATAALANSQYRKLYPPKQGRRKLGSPRRAASKIKWAVLNGTPARRLMSSSSHNPYVRKARVLAWRLLMHPGRRGR